MWKFCFGLKLIPKADKCRRTPAARSVVAMSGSSSSTIDAYFNGEMTLTPPSVAGLDLSGDGDITLTLKDFNNGEATMQVFATDTIAAVKERLGQYAPPDTLKLTAAGNPLLDSLTVGDYDLVNDAVVYVFINLHGGGKSTRGFGIRPQTL